MCLRVIEFSHGMAIQTSKHKWTTLVLPCITLALHLLGLLCLDQTS